MLTRHIEMLDALFKHATEGIIVVDKSGTIVMANPKAKMLFGLEDSELIGNKIEMLIPARFSANHVDYRNQYMESPKARGMGHLSELFAKKADGSEFPVEVSLSPFKTTDGDFVVSFIIDITDRKKHETQLREANLEIQELNGHLEERVRQRTMELAEAVNKIEHSQQEVLRALEKEKELNQMKSQFVNIASHEFRTPLATILSSASLIGKYTASNDEQKRQKHVDRIKSAVNNLTEILNDFLSIGRLEEGRIQSIPVLIDLQDFCTNLTEEIQGLCKEGQQIQFQYAGISHIWLDKQLLRNILFNLLSNGIKYSDAGKPVFLNVVAGSDIVKIEVRDQGIGIPNKDQAKVFDRFFRAQNAGTVQGTGLGLHIARGYVDLMGGSFSLVSELGKGTTFFVNLPNTVQDSLSA